MTPGASFFACETLIIQLISELPASLLNIIFLVFRSPDSDCKMTNLKHLSFPAPAAKIPNASECKMSKAINAINKYENDKESLFLRVCFLLQGPPHLLISNFNNFSIKNVINACLFQ